MGAGKSYLGKWLAAQDISIVFRDLDDLIFQNCGKGLDNLGQFITLAGWDRFREEETRYLREVIAELANTSKAVVALGGGSLLLEENCNLVKNCKNCRILFLATHFEECYQRIKDGKDRPLAQLGKEAMRELYQKRMLSYQNIADACIADSEKITCYEDLEQLF
jgi:shikimate kinase